MRRKSSKAYFGLHASTPYASEPLVGYIETINDLFHAAHRCEEVDYVSTVEPLTHVPFFYMTSTIAFHTDTRLNIIGSVQKMRQSAYSGTNRSGKPAPQLPPPLPMIALVTDPARDPPIRPHRPSGPAPARCLPASPRPPLRTAASCVSSPYVSATLRAASAAAPTSSQHSSYAPRVPPTPVIALRLRWPLAEKLVLGAP